MPNYSDHFNSADWEHEKRKHSHSKRRHKEKVKKANLFKMAKSASWTPYYVVDKVPVYDKTIVSVIPAHTEKEKCFYTIKNGTYWYTDKKGVAHYIDNYVWRETGREIFYPERVVRSKHITGYRQVEPHLKRCDLSGRKRFAKEMTHRMARRKFGQLEHILVDNQLPDHIDISKSSDHKCFDYSYTVW